MYGLRSRIVKYLEHDLACGIALGFFEQRQARVTLEAITLYDRGYRVLDLKPNWLGADPLDLATRAYLEAKRAIGRFSGKGNPMAARAREAMEWAIAARARGREILEKQEAWVRAREAGMTILG